MDPAERLSVRAPLAAVLGLLAVAELAARLTDGATVRAGVAAGPVTHTGASLLTALLMGAFCLLATVPAGLRRPVPAALAVWVAALLSLALFELVTVAGAAALVMASYRLARTGGRILALALAVPFLGLAVVIAAAVSRPVLPPASVSGLALAGLARGERAGIARELHDVVAHHISVIAVQAETARLTTPGLPDAGAQRFAAIGDTARAGLTEMRRLLGVLREDVHLAGPEPLGPVADRHPQPGLGPGRAGRERG